MTVYYIDPQLGDNGNNGLTDSAPKLSFPSGANGDVYRVKRGTTLHATGQIGFGTRQGIIITSYGNPTAPRPIIEAIHDASSSSLNMQGDAIFFDIDFDYIQRSGTQTTQSNVGQNAILFGTRGGATVGTAEGVSGVIINCAFRRIGNNAISFNGINSASQYAYAAPVGIVLGCEFDDLGGDCVFGAVAKYFEIGHNVMTNMGTRIDPSVTPNPGGRQSAADGINLIYGATKFGWIHDNYIDHSLWDCKHAVMIDAPDPNTSAGYVLIERNVIIGYGAGATIAQSVNNVGVNCELPALIRNNYIRGTRLLLFTSTNAADTEVCHNVFDPLSVDAGSPAVVSISGTRTRVHNNVVWAPTYLAGAKGINQQSSATQFQAYENVLGNCEEGLSLVNPTQATHTRNAYYNCRRNISSSGAALAADVYDVEVSPENFANVGQRDFTPNDLRLMFRKVDKAEPDFWGRFGSQGIGYIGAVTGTVL